jgi:hypothetical protein
MVMLFLFDYIDDVEDEHWKSIPEHSNTHAEASYCGTLYHTNDWIESTIIANTTCPLRTKAASLMLIRSVAPSLSMC